MADIRVLHVDDEPDVRLLVEASLGLDPGLVTQSCASGAEALAIAAHWRPDVILLDATMPDMDGPATLARLKHDPHTAGIPVLFLTASHHDSDVDQFKAMGSVGVIAKPFDPRALAPSVRSHAQPLPAEPATAQQDLAPLKSPAGATTPDAGALHDAAVAPGTSMASGLGATSVTPGEASGIAFVDRSSPTPAAGGGQDWGSTGRALDGHLAFLDLDLSDAGSVGTSVLDPMGAGYYPAGSLFGSLRASGHDASSDLVYAQSWQGADPLATSSGHDVFAIGFSFSPPHGLKPFG